VAPQTHTYPWAGGITAAAALEDKDLKTYEGMFLLDAGQADYDAATQPILSVLARNGAEIVQVKKWDERRLAYEIRGRRRGLYVLTYFRAAADAIANIERDVQLDEGILRVLILSADHVGAETMAAATPAEAEQQRREAEAEQAQAKPAEPAAAAKPAEAAHKAVQAAPKAKAEAKAEAEPAGEAEAKAEAKAEAEPAGEAEAKAGAEPAGEAEAKAEVKAGAEPAGEAEAKAEAEPAGEAEAADSDETADEAKPAE